MLYIISSWYYNSVGDVGAVWLIFFSFQQQLQMFIVAQSSSYTMCGKRAHVTNDCCVQVYSLFAGNVSRRVEAYHRIRFPFLVSVQFDVILIVVLRFVMVLCGQYMCAVFYLYTQIAHCSHMQHENNATIESRHMAQQGILYTVHFCFVLIKYKSKLQIFIVHNSSGVVLSLALDMSLQLTYIVNTI